MVVFQVKLIVAVSLFLNFRDIGLGMLNSIFLDYRILNITRYHSPKNR